MKLLEEKILKDAYKETKKSKQSGKSYDRCIRRNIVYNIIRS